MSAALSANDLSQYYGEFCALAPTSFAIPGGEIIVLTGPNGAGKSTMLLCLSGLLRPSSGTIEVSGYDLYEHEVEAKKRLAFVADVPRFYTELTAYEHLKFIALAHHAEEGFERRVRNILGELGLWDARDLYPHNYSRGMRLKLGLALALVRPFDTLILDEPTSALDPQAVEYLKDVLNNLRRDGAAVLLTSHNLELIAGLSAQHWRMEHGTLEMHA